MIHRLKVYYEWLCVYLDEASKLKAKRPELYDPSGLALDFPRWMYGHRQKASSIEDKLPWISFSAIAFFKKILTNDMKIFEYGSGGSTLFFAGRAARVFSVEHDRSWYNNVQQAVHRCGYNNSRVMLAAAEKPSGAFNDDPSDPSGYASSDDNFKGMSFENYVKKIDEFDDGYFDIVIVDGRSRPACAKRAMKKVKTGGYLVIDNSERDTYKKASDLFNSPDWQLRLFSGPSPYMFHFSETSFWKKIKE